MRNFIYILVLIVSTNLYAQSGIENDELFLKYEQAYLNMNSQNEFNNYEQAIKNFYTSFVNYKDRSKFTKTKDKERWLNKNYSKLNLNSATEALNLYNALINSKAIIDSKNKVVEDTRNELLKKYDVNLVWETLQNRIKARK
ncbi:hypothetical protein [Paenimyroides viscosum]|uniref:Uncharacterized protein n=1 Tax=Paenimyroides viscosum TaxID=2488729 RepID=A0A3P1AQB7_9FLAO|nr:hypothetical protein [Paenimyroides viscosum]RRA91095.1 hypothetical protein EG242_13060 [Paenimyroides viscosum]